MNTLWVPVRTAAKVIDLCDQELEGAVRVRAAMFPGPSERAWVLVKSVTRGQDDLFAAAGRPLLFTAYNTGSADLDGLLSEIVSPLAGTATRLTTIANWAATAWLDADIRHAHLRVDPPAAQASRPFSEQFATV